MTARPVRGRLDFVLVPFPEESLTSWFVRLARANAISLHELATRLFGYTRHSTASTDLDANANPAIPDGLARAVGLSAETVRRMMLANWQHLLSANAYGARRAKRWILPQRKDGSASRRGEWTQACLRCLADDPTPYFRTHWRLAFITECSVHRVEMAASCLRCAAPLDFPRMDTGKPRPSRHWPLTKCPACGVDWRIYAHRQRPSDVDLWRMQSRMLRAVAQQWYILSGDPVWIGLLLDGVHQLLRSLRVPRTIAALARTHYSGEIQPPASWTNTRRAFEHLPIHERRALLRYAAAALDDWPYSFVELARRCHITLFALRASKERPPYWLDHVGENYLNRTWFRQSLEEAESVQNVLESHGLSAKPWAIREWMGFYVPKRRLGVLLPSSLGASQLRFWPIESEVEGRLRQAFAAKIAKALRKWCLRRIRDERRSSVNAPASRPPHQASFWMDELLA